MPIREDEKFAECFLADTQEEAEILRRRFKVDIEMLARSFANFYGMDSRDLEQEGLIGLARASCKFEAGRSEDFRIFAIYKIKDAMREFVATQANNVRVPQYIRDAVRLANNLRKVLEKAGYESHKSIIDMWNDSSTLELEANLRTRADEIRTSLDRLAVRSYTTVIQLLERAELVPLTTAVSLDIYDGNYIIDNCANEEDDMVSYLLTKESINNIKAVLTPEEYKLIYDFAVEGKTLREIALEIEKKAPSVYVRISNIKEKLIKNKKKILKYETDTDIEKVEPRYAG